MDFIRCSPEFHNQPRHDFIIYEKDNELVFAQLVLLFKCHIDCVNSEQQDQTIALVHPYNQPIPARERPRKDKELGLLRYRSRPRNLCEFIHVGSIIRGALSAKDPDVRNERFVVDVVDTDMFLRLRNLHRI